MGVYLDFNSTAPIDERVLEEMIKIYRNTPGNADSRTHTFGDDARRAVETARAEVASLLGVNKDEVFFTSGATESNNIAIQGLREYAEKTGKKHIITTSVEHKSVLGTCKALEQQGFEVSYVNPKADGRVSVEEVTELVREDTVLVSIMHVNNETGIIQPIKEIGEFLADKETFFHIDATQSFGKLVDELKAIKYDMLSMSAHKIAGPQGGQQERGIRPGTIPVALVVGLGTACALVASEYKQNQEKCLTIKNALLEELNASGVKCEINGDQNYCVPSTLNICFNGVSSEALMLSTKQYCGISNGSACNSKSYEPSYVLTAMGIPTEKIENTVRISWGAESDCEDVVTSFKELLAVAKSFAAF